MSSAKSHQDGRRTGDNEHKLKQESFWQDIRNMSPNSTKVWFCGSMNPDSFKANILWYNFAGCTERSQHSSGFFGVVQFELESPYCSKTQSNCSFSQRGLEVLIKLMHYELSIWISQPSQPRWNKLYALLKAEYHHTHVINKEVSKEKT